MAPRRRLGAAEAFSTSGRPLASTQTAGAERDASAPVTGADAAGGRDDRARRPRRSEHDVGGDLPATVCTARVQHDLQRRRPARQRARRSVPTSRSVEISTTLRESVSVRSRRASPHPGDGPCQLGELRVQDVDVAVESLPRRPVRRLPAKARRSSVVRPRCRSSEAHEQPRHDDAPADRQLHAPSERARIGGVGRDVGEEGDRDERRHRGAASAARASGMTMRSCTTPAEVLHRVLLLSAGAMPARIGNAPRPWQVRQTLRQDPRRGSASGIRACRGRCTRPPDGDRPGASASEAADGRPRRRPIGGASLRLAAHRFWTYSKLRVDLGLHLREHLLVALLEQVLEAALRLEELLDAASCCCTLTVWRQWPSSTSNSGQKPVCTASLAISTDLLYGMRQPRGHGREHVDERRALRRRTPSRPCR